jgi:hypothetical protein
MALQLNQHSWQAEVGALDASDAIGSSGQTATKLADMTLSESGKEWLVGGSCG